MGHVTLTRISSKATSCQIVAKTVKGFWTALSDVSSVRQLRITTQRVVKFVSVLVPFS